VPLVKRPGASSISAAGPAIRPNFWSRAIPAPKCRHRFLARYAAPGARSVCRIARFVEGDLATWVPEPGTDLLFGNAVFHWVPDHPNVLARLLQALPPGGVLAVQMPDNTREPALTMMDKVAASGPWAAERSPRPAAPATTCRDQGEYYDLLRPLCRHFDIWHTHYNHVLEDHMGVVEWFKGSSLRPYLAPLDAADARSVHRGLCRRNRARLFRTHRRQGAAEVSPPVHRRGTVAKPADNGSHTVGPYSEPLPRLAIGPSAGKGTR
jgi:SAM-dependent methyltransferase